jgi:uncharacterized protein (DUF433 family)
MGNDLIHERIVTDNKTFAGKPTIRNTRVAVEHILGMLADGSSEKDILLNFPFLESEDIRAAILYAQQIISSEHIEIIHKSVS